jgi:DNA-binding transcriptional regulator YhcF (GntR family)
LSEPLLVLDPRQAKPPSEQIEEQLRLQIAAESLAAGAALPSVRQLARDLGIAPNTVVRAYNELERQGWVVASARRGFAVADVAGWVRQAERRQKIEQAVAQLLVTGRRLGVGGSELHAELERQLAARADLHAGPAQQDVGASRASPSYGSTRHARRPYGVESKAWE